eukprot:2258520-Rhodomonas_salina.2
MPPPAHAPPVLTVLWAAADVETSHLAWCHPRKSKSVSVQTQHLDIFPMDEVHRKAVRDHRCLCV